LQKVRLHQTSLGLQKLDPLVKKDFAPAIHAKALYDITDGLKKKNAAR
jgi:hypothetical protein